GGRGAPPGAGAAKGGRGSRARGSGARNCAASASRTRRVPSRKTIGWEKRRSFARLRAMGLGPLRPTDRQRDGEQNREDSEPNTGDGEKIRARHGQPGGTP